MISEEITSGGGSERKHRQCINNVSKGQVFKIEKYFSRFNVVIIFSSSDFNTVRFSHDDTLVLALKMGPVGREPRPRVKSVLINIKSFADILYKSTFDQIGLSIDRLSQI
jgi:hypothetical protein